MPTNDWLSTSEVCFGLILQGKDDINKYSPSLFIPPYDKGFEVLKETGDKTKVAQAISAGTFQTAMDAATTVSTVEFDWAKLLKFVSVSYQVGKVAEKVGKQLQRGDEVDPVKIMELVKSFQNLSDPDAIGLIETRLLDWENYQELHLSGWAAIDDNLGGIVRTGNILVMGKTGLGKSFWSNKFLTKYLSLYPEKKAAVYSLEMPSVQWVARAMKLYGNEGFKEVHERGQILVSDKIVSITDVGMETASTGADIVVVDYADYLVKGEPSEGAYFKIYIEMNNISRSLGIPFVMLLQPNRQQYSGSGVPEMWYARYSGMAENVAAQFFALWKPKDEEECNGDFIYEEDSMYMLAHKQRAGWLPKKPGPGAIVMRKTDNIWADTGVWQIRGDVPTEMSRAGKKKRRIE